MSGETPADAASLVTQPLGLAWSDPVHWFDVTLPAAEENLALDEVLLSSVDDRPTSALLRLWEPDRYCIVLGRSNRAMTEVNQAACRDAGIPILRRASGGGTVLLGPGCLAYSLVLPLSDECRTLGVTVLTRAIMERIAACLRPLVPEVAVCGTSDLAVGGLKFSGNAQRWLKHALLHHGTILYGFDLELIQRLLSFPSRQPDYRAGRAHRLFVTNVPATRTQLVDALVAGCGASSGECDASTIRLASELAASRYQTPEWNLTL